MAHRRALQTTQFITTKAQITNETIKTIFAIKRGENQSFIISAFTHSLWLSGRPKNRERRINNNNNNNNNNE